jgi:hypothetical protein
MLVVTQSGREMPGGYSAELGALLPGRPDNDMPIGQMIKPAFRRALIAGGRAGHGEEDRRRAPARAVRRLSRLDGWLAALPRSRPASQAKPGFHADRMMRGQVSWRLLVIEQRIS